jgi:Calcineurin-like phosphoesterase
VTASGDPRPPIPDTGVVGDYKRLPTGSPNSWLRPEVLWRSRNDILSRFHDPVDAIREAWLALQDVPAGPRRADALRIRGHEERSETSFLLLGDTGEGDGSQMAVVPGLLATSEGAHFTVICSDAIYPAGEASDYAAKFYAPYKKLPGPVYAIPGNHDWYDRLVGFMTHFCDAVEAPPAGVGMGDGRKGWLVDRLWRKERKIRLDTVASGENRRPRDPRFPSQRGPYWTLDAGRIRLVGIDTGITGGLDAAQGDWLRRVSAERPDAAKILLTGKPILVDGDYRPGEIAGSSLKVDDIVRDPKHGYVAAIGGDIHNYQRYPVTLADGRTLQYIVAGGGGAFMHATHKIPNIDGEDGLAAKLREKMGERTTLSEQQTRFFPARAWSLYWYARLLGPGKGEALGLTYTEAGAAVGEELGLEPLDPAGRELLERYRRDGWPPRLHVVRTLLYRRLPAPGKLFQRFLSEIIDRNDPPMAKSFLRIDATQTQVRIRCFRATGWRPDEIEPPLEDEVTIPIG